MSRSGDMRQSRVTRWSGYEWSGGRTGHSVSVQVVEERLLVSADHTEREKTHLGFGYRRTGRRRLVKALDKRSNRRDDRHNVLGRGKPHSRGVGQGHIQLDFMISIRDHFSIIVVFCGPKTSANIDQS